MILVIWDGISTRFKKASGTPLQYISETYTDSTVPINIVWNSLCTIEVSRIPLTRALRECYNPDAKGIQGGKLLTIPAVLLEEGVDPNESIHLIVLKPLEENELLKLGIG